jgi:DNA-binding GntR family transcriptional regulator
MMQHLVQQGFLTTKKKSGTTVFSPISLQSIKKRFEVHQKTLTSLNDKQDDLDRERSALSSTYHHDTSIQIFE